PTPIGAAVLASVAIGDIDGDGLLDVVTADVEGKVYAWDYRGKRKPGFPVQVNRLYSSHAVRDPANTVDRVIIGYPVLAALGGDIDHDGTPDIVVGTNEEYDEPPNFSLTSTTASALAPVLSPANSRVYAIHRDGNNHAGGPFLPGWPVKIGILSKELLPVVGE